MDAGPDGGGDMGGEGEGEGAPSNPPELLITVNEIPAAMNGSEGYRQSGGALKRFSIPVNEADFTLDVRAQPGSGPIDWASLELRCDAPLVLPSGQAIDAGALFGDDSLEARAEGGWRSLRLTGQAALPPASRDGARITCDASAAALDGQGPATSAISFQPTELTARLDPFAEVDTWLVVTSRDIFATTVQDGEDGVRRVASEYLPEGDGRVDFDEAFEVLGLWTSDAPEVAAVIRTRLLESVRAHTHDIFGLDDERRPAGLDSVRLRLTFEGDPGAPSPDEFDGGGFSMIALGGDGKPSAQADRLVGQAGIDWNNQGREDNTVYGRGVYTTAIARMIFATPGAPSLLASILPGEGEPFGSRASDVELVADDFDPAGSDIPDAGLRHTLLKFALDLGGLALASTLSHEIGHSLGLVPLGPPPEGLFGDVAGLDFTANDLDGAHIDTEGVNVMQTGKVTNYLEVLAGARPRFNALNLAYLRRRLVVR